MRMQGLEKGDRLVTSWVARSLLERGFCWERKRGGGKGEASKRMGGGGLNRFWGRDFGFPPA